MTFWAVTCCINIKPTQKCIDFTVWHAHFLPPLMFSLSSHHQRVSSSDKDLAGSSDTRVRVASAFHHPTGGQTGRLPVCCIGAAVTHPEDKKFIWDWTAKPLMISSAGGFDMSCLFDQAHQGFWFILRGMKQHFTFLFNMWRFLSLWYPEASGLPFNEAFHVQSQVWRVSSSLHFTLSGFSTSTRASDSYGMYHMTDKHLSLICRSWSTPLSPQSWYYLFVLPGDVELFI